MNKKGLSSTVGNVLIVLMVVASISIIGFAILKMTNGVDSSLKISECKNLYLNNEEGYRNCITDKFGVEKANEILGEGTNSASDSLDPIDGVCGSAINTCTLGHFQPVFDESRINLNDPAPVIENLDSFINSFSDNSKISLWKCAGENGGTSADCSLDIGSTLSVSLLGREVTIIQKTPYIDQSVDAVNIVNYYHTTRRVTTKTCGFAPGLEKPSCNAEVDGEGCPYALIGTYGEIDESKTVDTGDYKWVYANWYKPNGQILGTGYLDELNCLEKSYDRVIDVDTIGTVLTEVPEYVIGEQPTHITDEGLGIDEDYYLVSLEDSNGVSLGTSWVAESAIADYKLNIVYTSSACFTFNQKGLVAYYCFDDNFNDSSGMNNHGTGYNNVSFENIYATGNTAGKFDGKDDNVRVENISGLSSTPSSVTVSVWVKDANNLRYEEIFNLYGTQKAAHNNLSVFGLSASVNTVFYLLEKLGTNRKPTTYINDVVDDSISIGKWKHIVLEFSPKAHAAGAPVVYYVKGFVNGVKTFDSDSLGYTISNLAINDTSLVIGGRATAFFNGSLDELMIYNRTLSDDEVNKLYIEQKDKFWNYNFDSRFMHYEIFMDLDEAQRELAMKDLEDLYAEHQYWVGETPEVVSTLVFDDLKGFLKDRWTHTISLYTEELDLQVKYGIRSATERDNILSVYQPIWSTEKESQFWNTPSSNQITGMAAGGEGESCGNLAVYDEPNYVNHVVSEGPSFPALGDAGESIGGPEKIRADLIDYDVYLNPQKEIVSRSCTRAGFGETTYKFREQKLSLQADGFNIYKYSTFLDRYMISNDANINGYVGAHKHTLAEGETDNARYDVLRSILTETPVFTADSHFHPLPHYDSNPTGCVDSKSVSIAEDHSSSTFEYKFSGGPGIIKTGLNIERYYPMVVESPQAEVTSVEMAAIIDTAQSLGLDGIADLGRVIGSKTKGNILEAGCKLGDVSVKIKVKPFDKKCVVKIGDHLEVIGEAKAKGNYCILARAGFDF